MATIQELEKDLKNLIKNDALGQAYVFFGPQVAELFSIARQLANFLEHKKWQEPGKVLLDARFIDGEAQNLGVDEARQFSEFLYRHPVESPRRTLVVSSAHELTPQAQNAILKLVEEPPAHALIILTLRDTGALLVPLLSRLQKIYVSGSGEGSLSETEQRAAELVEKFLLSSGPARDAFIKDLVAQDKETVEKSAKIVDTFLRTLIVELAKRPEQNARALREALRRQTAISDYSTNKKLQLEALLPYLT